MYKYISTDNNRAFIHPKNLDILDAACERNAACKINLMKSKMENEGQNSEIGKAKFA